MNRYNRHIILSEVGQEGQNKLNKTKVLVVGAGGLGCPLLQYLAAAGIGTIGIIDYDTVDISNLQRQVLFGMSTLGINKAIAAKDRLEDLNPTVSIIAISEQLISKNALELFKAYDIIIDGSDNFATRYLISDASVLTNKPVVYGAIYKFEGQVSVFNYNNGPSYRCLFPNHPKEGSVANCSEVGVLGVLPGIIGTMMANEVIKIVLGFNGVLSGRLLCYNSRSAETSTLKIERKQSEFDKVLAHSDLSNLEENNSCEIEVEEISLDELQSLDNIQFIDVREFNEQPKIKLDNYIQIPLSELKENTNKIDASKTIVAFCTSGIRSKNAIEILKTAGFMNCYSLAGGITTLNKIESI